MVDGRDLQKELARAELTRRELLKGITYGAAVLSFGGLAVACAGDDEGETSGTRQELKVHEISSLPGNIFLNSPHHVAEELGFYRDEGIDFTIEFTGSSVVATQALVSGGRGVAYIAPFATMVAHAGGFPLKAFFETFHGSPFGFAVVEDSPITAWEIGQIRGLTIGITEFSGGDVPVLRGALARLGLTPGQDVTLKPIGGGGPETVEALESGAVDMMAGAVSFDLAAVEAGGVRLRLITPDYLNEFPGHTYAVPAEEFDTNRDAIARWARARAKALVFIRANPEATSEITIAASPESTEGLSVEDLVAIEKSFWIDTNQQYFQEGNEAFHRIGLIDIQDWVDHQDYLIQGGVEEEGAVLTEPVDLESIIDNAVIDVANDFDYAEIEALARDYSR